MSDRIISKLLVRDNRLERLVKLLKINAEEVWLNFCKLIKLNKGVFEDCLILFCESLSYHCSHQCQKFDEFFCVLALRNRQVVRQGLEGSKFDVKLLELKCSLKNTSKFIFVLYQVVQDVTKQSVEDHKSGVNLRLVLALNERKKQVK